MKFRRFFCLIIILTLIFSIFVPSVCAFNMSSKAYLAMDLKTGTILYQKNMEKKMYPAGLTKMLTALLVVENCSLDEKVTISKKASSEHSDSLKLKEGEELTVKNLLLGMMMVSSNGAAVALAEHVSENTNSFVELMNKRLEELECKNTHFVNPTGLHSTRHYTTVQDMAKIARVAVKNENFMTVCDTAYCKIPPTNVTENERVLYTDNHFLSRYKIFSYYYRPAEGVCQGFTSEAGNCLISTAKKNKSSLHLLTIVMGAPKSDSPAVVLSFNDTRTLFDSAFDNFKLHTIVEENELLSEAHVELGKTKDFATVGSKESLYAVLPIDSNLEKVEKVVTLEEPIKAPVKVGDVLGKIDIVYKGHTLTSGEVISLQDVEQSNFLVFMDFMLMFTQNIFVKLVAIALIIAIIVYIYITISRHKRRKRIIERNRIRRMR